jgi:FRG domain
VGAGKRDAEITIRELCLLHGRDPLGTPRQSVETVLRERSDPITWTDLEELLVHGRSNQRLLDYLQGRDRIDDEKWAFGHAAFDFLEKRAAHLPGGLEIAVYDSIWDVVWSHPWLDRGERYIFRGQVDSRWSLSPSLFRPGGVLPPDVGTLLKRIELTEAFVRELRGRASELLDAGPSDEELLAIAQHYGFPTPLLDFTRSFAVGAFFATHRMIGSSDEAIGIVYYIKQTRAEFAAERGLRSRLNVGAFSLLDAARLRFGDVHVIEPRLRDVDNRISRQRGVFLAGYQVRDLQQVSIDRLRFRQRPGEIFEDPSRGITAAKLLPPDSPIEILARDVRARAGRRRRTLNAGLASARLPANPLIGSDGAQLFAQVRAAADFFDELRELVPAETIDALAVIFDDYFRAARARADVDEALNLAAPTPGTPPIVTATDALANLTGTDADRLWAAVFRELKPGPADDFLGEPRAAPLDAQTADERLAFACALFLAAWEHLQFVGGTAGRRLLKSARSVLRGWSAVP